MARARRLAPAPAGGRRRTGSGRARLRRRAGRPVPMARVRRLLLVPPVHPPPLPESRGPERRVVRSGVSSSGLCALHREGGTRRGRVHLSSSRGCGSDRRGTAGGAAWLRRRPHRHWRDRSAAERSWPAQSARRSSGTTFLYGTAAALVFPQVFFPGQSQYAGVIASFGTQFRVPRPADRSAISATTATGSVARPPSSPPC